MGIALSLDSNFTAPRAARKGKRLLLLSTNMGMGGGAEEQVIRLAYAFQERAWSVLVVSMLPPKKMPKDFAVRGFPLTDLGMRRGIPDLRAIYRLARLIADFQPDVVHSHMTHANLMARAVRVVRPFPVLVNTLHALTMAGVERDRTAVFEVAHRLTEAMADRTTAICHAASDYYVRRGAVLASKMMVIPNGIDSQIYVPDPIARDKARAALDVTGRFTWLAAGRLTPVKAYPTLLRAFAQRGPDSGILLICGQGSLDAELRALAVELGIGDRVRFLGLRGDIPAIMNAADAFVLSSDSEGLPLVLLQAAASALPIIATNVGGNAEAVVEGVNGHLVPPGDPAAFAQAMNRLSALTPENRAAMGLAGRARVQSLFEAERVVDQWENLFNELLHDVHGVTARPRRRAMSSPREKGGLGESAPAPASFRGRDYAA